MKYFTRKVNRFTCNKMICLLLYEVLFIICNFLFKLILIKYATFQIFTLLLCIIIIIIYYY